MLNKLARTLARARFKKYRSAGEQAINVQHVTVNDGGQSILGNVQWGGDAAKDGRRPHGLFARMNAAPALFCHGQALTTPVPSSGCARLEGVPVPRGAGWGAKGQS
jgi:hypothetical protein